MWNQNQSFNDQPYDNKAGGGGGFLNSQSPGIGGTQEKKKRSQNVVPMAIRQITEDTQENLTLCGQEVHMVSIMGIVMNVETVTTKVTYTLQDSTGEIAAVKWLEGDGTDKNANIIENTYVRVIGTPRMQQGKKHVMIFKISPLQDINLITTHILEVIKAPMAIEEVNRLQQEGITGAAGSNMSMNTSVTGGGGAPQAMDQSVGGGGGGGVAASLNPEQRLVYVLIKGYNNDEGVHKAEVMQSLRGKMTTKAVESAVEFLSNEGHIYSTVDEDHYKTTDD